MITVVEKPVLWNNAYNNSNLNKEFSFTSICIFAVFIYNILILRMQKKINHIRIKFKKFLLKGALEI